MKKLPQAEFWNFLESVSQVSLEDAEDTLKARMATDLELFARTYFAHYCQYDFNSFHRDVFSQTEFGERSVRRARAAPRGYAKSTLVSLIKPIHDVCFALESFIILISSTQDQANGKLRDIRSEILGNTKLINDFGIKFARSNPGEESYEVVCGNHRVRFEAHGSRVEIRGVRFGSSRPSKIIVDDAEDSDEVLKEELRQKDEDWYFQVISQIGDKHTNIDFVGTLLHHDSLLAKLLRNPAYNGKIYKAVISWATNQKLWQEWKDIYTNLDNERRADDATAFFEANKAAMLEGTDVLWPEKESYVELMREMVEKGTRNFMKEKQNEPITGDDALFDEIHTYREVPEGIKLNRSGVIIPWDHLKHNAYGVIDPATGQDKAKKGKAGDYTCLLTGFQDPKGRLFVHRDWTKRAAPTKYIHEIFEHHEEFNYNKFGVETNLYRNLLLQNIIEERKRRERERKEKGIKSYGIQISFYDIENIENKHKRIYTLEPKVTHGYIVFNEALSTEFMNMIHAFPKGDHDDGPDALEMLWGLVNGRYKLSPLNIDPMKGR
jgi:predicted phage terminase large subunit-like protein